jgi:hypothetical protein
MISLHAGRLLLVCDRADRNWHARVVLGPKPELQIEMDTGTPHLQTALLKAQLIFQAARKKLRPQDGPLMCWDCHYWTMRQQRCGLELPESKRSGGRYAVRCEMYARPGSHQQE